MDGRLADLLSRVPATAWAEVIASNTLNVNGWQDADFSCSGWCASYGREIASISLAEAEADTSVAADHIDRLRPLIVRGGARALLPPANGTEHLRSPRFWKQLAATEEWRAAFLAFHSVSVDCADTAPAVPARVCELVHELCAASNLHSSAMCVVANPKDDDVTPSLERPSYWGWRCGDACRSLLGLWSRDAPTLPRWMSHPRGPTACPRRGANLTNGEALLWLGGSGADGGSRSGVLGASLHVDGPTTSRAVFHVQLFGSKGWLLVPHAKDAEGAACVASGQCGPSVGLVEEGDVLLFPNHAFAHATWVPPDTRVALTWQEAVPSAPGEREQASCQGVEQAPSSDRVELR